MIQQIFKKRRHHSKIIKVSKLKLAPLSFFKYYQGTTICNQFKEKRMTSIPTNHNFPTPQNQDDTLQDLDQTLVLEDTQGRTVQSPLGEDQTLNLGNSGIQTQFNASLPHEAGPTLLQSFNSHTEAPSFDKAPSDAWMGALRHLQRKDYTNAYREILSSGDDIYLVRLMMHTGASVIPQLPDSVAANLFKKVVNITKNHFIDDLVLGFYFEACEANLADSLDKETKELMLMALETMKSSCQEDNPNKRMIQILYMFLQQHMSKFSQRSPF